ncbi:LysM domain-containing protein [Enterococcus gilvus]|uniref:LysM peptidoglycan-binding domain-containing protein n=1 Tax=Enterococcus gilvus TaxID=160453 RepID=UPI0029134B39|nr:LysM domain-containing protein [Enterococcus gilvus]MDU5510521.1 LysM domain-containing protein [Enterococcus gilvus]
MGISLLSSITLGVLYDTDVADASAWQPRSVEQIKSDIDDSGQYTVQSGDTLSAIAEALNLDLTVFASANNINHVNQINVGDSLITKISTSITHALTFIPPSASIPTESAYQEFYYEEPQADTTTYFETPAVEGSGDTSGEEIVPPSDVEPFPLLEPQVEDGEDDEPLENPHDSVEHELPAVDDTDQ